MDSGKEQDASSRTARKRLRTVVYRTMGFSVGSISVE
jgi:hypothetical protein